MIAREPMSADPTMARRPVPGVKLDEQRAKKAGDVPKALFVKHADLDMGEASREQGFKLFGCR